MTETDDSEYEVFDRPVTESVTAWAGSDTDHPSGEHLKFSNRPVTESVTAREADTEEPLVINVSTVTISGSDKDISSDKDSKVFDQPFTEPVTSRAGSDTDLPSHEHSEFFGRPVTDSVTAQTGSYTDFPNGKHSEFVRKNIQYHCVTRTSICNEENSSVNSGTDGRNSYIGVLAEVDPRYTPEMLEEIRRINEMGFRSDEDSIHPSGNMHSNR